MYNGSDALNFIQEAATKNLQKNCMNITRDRCKPLAVQDHTQVRTIIERITNNQPT